MLMKLRNRYEDVLESLMDRLGTVVTREDVLNHHRTLTAGWNLTIGQRTWNRLLREQETHAGRNGEDDGTCKLRTNAASMAPITPSDHHTVCEAPPL
ncbi:hypothetical protein PRZ48_005388 [Zasmidium cellare]|uniref:Uncharacterized protein n=1 Tax=Zasmidium cellare TaxID=395010 RepID=A0ABR0ESL7_ZASCE|nr:hypothetical protein PRZ48_005388 [Zasmidium cellare]